MSLSYAQRDQDKTAVPQLGRVIITHHGDQYRTQYSKLREPKIDADVLLRLFDRLFELSSILVRDAKQVCNSTAMFFS